MKAQMITAMILVILLAVTGCTSQQSLTNGYDRQTIRQINRSINLEARRYRSEGYKPEVGAPAIEFQLRRAFEKEFETDEMGRAQYIIGVGNAIAGIENVAKLHAMSDAALHASMLLESKIMGLVENDYNNRLYSRDEFQNISKMRGVFSILLAESLPAGSPLIAFVRDQGRHYEYQVRVGYPLELLWQRSVEVISDILGQENDELRNKMERITGLDRLGEQ